MSRRSARRHGAVVGKEEGGEKATSRVDDSDKGGGGGTWECAPREGGVAVHCRGRERRARECSPPPHPASRGGAPRGEQLIIVNGVGNIPCIDAERYKGCDEWDS